MTPLLLLLVLAALLFSWAGTGLVRRYSLAQRLLDLPNARSSHQVPTPRGGGLAIVATVLTGLVLLRLLDAVPSDLALALLLGGSLVAGVGFWDDHRNLPAAPRLLVQVLAASLALYVLRVAPAFDLGPARLDEDPGSLALGLLFIVWLTNLYNFMDGIDGLAAGEAAFVALAGALLLASAPLQPLLLLLAAAALGFLIWNWPPARIFMGDVGSAFLGYCLAVIALYASRGETAALAPWLILLAVFVTDATVTLLRRALTGQPWWRAHRSHAYQKLAVRWGRHRPVTLAVLLLNVLVLAPLALWAARAPDLAFTLAVPVHLGLGALVLALGAGARD